MDTTQTPIADVLQIEPDPRDPRYGPVQVTVHGPVETRELPARATGYRTVTIDDPERLLTADPRRKSCIILSLTTDFWFGARMSSVDQTAARGARWPAAVPLQLDTSDEVWVSAVTPGTATDMTIIPSYWAS